MTKLLQQGIDAVRALPPDRQDIAGELLLSLAGKTLSPSLRSDDLDDLRLSIAEANRGEFASDEEMAETWKKFSR